jgi:hypothetical protein
MPLWLRRFTFNKLKEWFEAQKADSEKNFIDSTKSRSKVQIPDVMKNLVNKPTYTTKAPIRK